MQAVASAFPTRLCWTDAFLFPISTPQARRDVFTGGTLILLLWPIGWILNLGHRLNVVARLYHDDPPYFRGFGPWTFTLYRGCVSALAIAAYLSPALILSGLCYLAFTRGLAASTLIGGLAFAAFILAVFTLPGCMTVYAVEADSSVLRNPVVAFRRAWSRRSTYIRAWGIALAAISLSFLGLLALGIGFLYSSVWAWEVVGYAFTVAMYLPPGQPETAR